MVATIGSSILCMSLPYAPGLNAKHMAWAGKRQKQKYCLVLYRMTHTMFLFKRTVCTKVSACAV